MKLRQRLKNILSSNQRQDRPKTAGQAFGVSLKERNFPLNNKLRDELLSMQHEDQKTLQELIDTGKLGTVEYHPRLKEVHERNNKRIKEIIGQQGWPGLSLVGKEGAEAAWLIVQHAVLDTAFMASCLVLLREAVKRGEAEGSHFTYLKTEYSRCLESRKFTVPSMMSMKMVSPFHCQ